VTRVYHIVITNAEVMVTTDDQDSMIYCEIIYLSSKPHAGSIRFFAVYDIANIRPPEYNITKKKNRIHLECCS
jgi:hypothetical protein